jgi:hypothetical protein
MSTSRSADPNQFYHSQGSSDLSSISLLAFFIYLTDGVEAARDHVMRIISRLPQADFFTEILYQFLLQLLFYHTNRNASPASLTRDILELAVSTFPNNTIFLSLYLWGESGGRVHGRVQRLIAHLLQEGSIVGDLWAVWAEAAQCGYSFWDPASGGAERVRHALNKAVNTTS